MKCTINNHNVPRFEITMHTHYTHALTLAHTHAHSTLRPENEKMLQEYEVMLAACTQ